VNASALIVTRQHAVEDVYDKRVWNHGAKAGRRAS
jgi:hypothetical protein